MLDVRGDVDGHDGIQSAEAPYVGTIREPTDSAVVCLAAAGVAM